MSTHVVTSAGMVDITCACGQELHVPVTVSSPEGYTGDVNTLTAQLHVDHPFIAAHLATHDEAIG